jgi:pimeloyl-ACP methyl ester carboxylesterase
MRTFLERTGAMKLISRFCLAGLLFVAPAAAQEGTAIPRLGRVLGKAALDEAAEAVLSGAKAKFQKLHPAIIARRGRDPGLELQEGWQAAPAEQPLVIAIHGFYANREREASLLSAADEAGFPMGRFEFASEKPIGEAARLLSASLREIAAKDPDRSVVLVTHSMGGVVARSVVENPELDSGNVKQLLMIAPPNHGTALATLGLAARPAAGIEELEGQAAVGLGRAAILSVVGPAAAELQPDSPYLRELNARPRNPKIRYTIFLGTKAPLSASGIEVAEVAAEEVDRRWTRWVGKEFGKRLSELAEVRSGSGDGVVSVESGKLEGVNDVVLLPFHHNEPLWDPDEPAVEQLQREILSRLTGKK